ncbi:MAG: DUF3563 family protein [Gammaproteobacteria bacterium]
MTTRLPMLPLRLRLPMLPLQLPAWTPRSPHWTPRLQRYTLYLVLITVPGSTLIVPIVLWWYQRRRQAQRSESMNDADSRHVDSPAAAIVARASRGWDRSLHPFFEPLLGWIADAGREFADPQGRTRDAYLAGATDLADLEGRLRRWERNA